MTGKTVSFRVAAGLVGMLALLLTGCSSIPRAPLTETGEKIEMYVLSNRGDPDEMTERQYAHRNEVGQWMERDLMNILRRSGYEARQISSRDEFEPAPARYLLEMTIDSYHAGSSAARMMVGYGVGAASQDNSYALYGVGEEPLLDWTDGAGTSGHWTEIPRVLNRNTVRRITRYLRLQHP